jgi:capsular polysaccharide biosynthesis protein
MSQREGSCIASTNETQLAEGLDSIADQLATANIKRINAPANEQDIASRIKSSWVGRFYLKHLKRISLIRSLAEGLRRALMLFFIATKTRFYFGSLYRWRTLISLTNYVGRSQILAIQVLDAVRVSITKPKVFPEEDRSYLVSPYDHYTFPSVYVAELQEAVVYGGTNLVFSHEEVICHDLYDFFKDYTSEELHGRHVIDPRNMRMRLLRHDEAPEAIEVAASFVDATAANYAHWLTEVLPRIAAFCGLNQYAGAPIIINDGLHRNILESLVLMVGHRRQIIMLPVGRAIKVRKLYVTSAVGYVPFERRNATMQNHSHGIFCAPIFRQMSNFFNSYASAAVPHKYPTKVYLRRTSAARNITNSAEIEKTLVENGYVVIDPEHLSFMEQVSLFHNAEDVVSPTGAALANSIFSRPGSKCCVLMAKHENMIYRYWLNMLSPLGIQVSYVIGSPVQKNSSSIHTDFYVDLEQLANMLEI